MSSELDTLLAKLAAQLQAGKLPKPQGGPLTWAQVLNHVAQSIDCSLDGFPKHKSWLFQKVIGRAALRQFLGSGAMRHDRAAGIPGVSALVDADAAAALGRLQAAVARFAAHQGPVAAHFAYGAVTKEQYAQLHAMHLRDHLGD